MPTEDITITNTKSKKKNESHIFVFFSPSWKFSVDEINVNLFPFSQSKLNKYKKLRSKNRTQIKKKRITEKETIKKDLWLKMILNCNLFICESLVCVLSVSYFPKKRESKREGLERERQAKVLSILLSL